MELKLIFKYIDLTTNSQISSTTQKYIVVGPDSTIDNIPTDTTKIETGYSFIKNGLDFNTISLEGGYSLINQIAVPINISKNFKDDVDSSVDLSNVGVQIYVEANWGDWGFGIMRDGYRYAKYWPVWLDTVSVNDEMTVGNNTYIKPSFSINYFKNKRSGASINLEDLWFGGNIFEEILKYCKMYKILINVDEHNKTIDFLQSTTYFKKYNILDWTDKLDLSKDFNIQPISFQNKYVLFNYEDDESDLNKEYKTKFGVNYGEKKINTNYVFNEETKDLFSNIKTSINSTPYVNSWENLYTENKIIYLFPAEIYVADGNNNESIDISGKYFFYNKLENFDSSETLNLRSVCVTDDTEFQKTNNLYCYSQRFTNGYYYNVEKYPLCTTVEGGNCCLFNIPSTVYASDKTLFDNKKDIYTNFWKNYLDERYNKNNKVVTCYLDITPFDFCNFKFNNFIKLDNQLYFVNKIYDYDITLNSTTKVDLITIQDITGYTNSNFTLDYFEVFYNKGEVFDTDFHYIDLYKEDNTHTIYISSSSDVDWEITTVNYGDYDKVTINGVSGETGTIKSGIEVPVTFVNNYGTSSFEVTFTNEQGGSIVISVVAVAANSFTVTKSDGVEVMDYEPIRINTPSEQSTTLYVTSTEAPVKVSINDITKGTLEDITINGVNGSDIWRGSSEVVIPTGTNEPLTISGLVGADFSIDVELNNNKQLKIFTIVSTW